MIRPHNDEIVAMQDMARLRAVMQILFGFLAYAGLSVGISALVHLIRLRDKILRVWSWFLQLMVDQAGEP